MEYDKGYGIIKTVSGLVGAVWQIVVSLLMLALGFFTDEAGSGLIHNSSITNSQIIEFGNMSILYGFIGLIITIIGLICVFRLNKDVNME